MTALIDTHCHVDLDAFAEDRPAVLQRMLDAQVQAAVVIAYNPERWRTSSSLCDEHPYLTRAVGIHPNDASMWSGELRDDLERELAKGDAVAVGETGLDFYRDRASAELQREAFRAQLELARLFDLPIVIHQRSAEQEVVEMLRPFAPVKGVMHCFSGNSEYARACLDLGLHLGIGGVITYPKSSEIRDAVRSAPRDRLILETDAPFLAPQLIRGKRNEPSRIADIAVFLSKELGSSPEDVARETTTNAVALFGPTLEAAAAFGREQAL